MPQLAPVQAPAVANGNSPSAGSAPPRSGCGSPRCCCRRPQHLSAEQILASLRAAGARVSKATVYNTLNLFAAHGLIRQLSVDGSRAWFDSNVDPHYHFHDLDSGALIDVPVPAVEFSRLPAPPPGTEVAGIDLVIRLRKKM